MAGMKFKKSKKKAENKPKKARVNLQFPRNYRIIPEGWKADELFFFFGALFILVAILIVAFDLFLNLKEQNKTTDEKVALIKEQIFWQEQISKKPGYRDAYFSLALVDYRLNDLKNTKQNLEKALSLDPTFEEGRTLGQILNGN